MLYPGSPGSEVSFARQHNTSDNNNQCFLGSNGNSLLQLNPQKPGAIDNQPLVTQEPVKVKHILALFHHSFFMLAFFQLNSELMLFYHTAEFRLRGKLCSASAATLVFCEKRQHSKYSYNWKGIYEKASYCIKNKIL